MTDVYVRYAARRVNGVFSPESRLVLLIIPAFLVPAGLLMFGFGAERKLAWILPYVGYGLLNVVTAVASIAMTYVMDSYFEVAAEALLLINGGSKLIAWAFTYGFVPWTTSAGYESVCKISLFAILPKPLLIRRAGIWHHGSHLRRLDPPCCSDVRRWCSCAGLYHNKNENHLLVIDADAQ